MERNETGVANRMKRIIRTERVIPEQAAADEQVIRQVEQDLPDLTRQYWEKFGERLKTPEGMKALKDFLVNLLLVAFFVAFFIGLYIWCCNPTL